MLLAVIAAAALAAPVQPTRTDPANLLQLMGESCMAHDRTIAELAAYAQGPEWRELSAAETPDTFRIGLPPSEERLWSRQVGGETVYLRAARFGGGGVLCALAFKTTDPGQMQYAIAQQKVLGQPLGAPALIQAAFHPKRAPSVVNFMWSRTAPGAWRSVNYTFDSRNPGALQVLETAGSHP